MSWDYGAPENFDVSGRGLFIVCEGNFQYGNATLSYYDPAADSCTNEVFVRANGMRLGDVAQSMTMSGGLGWIVVNHSRVVFAIDPDTFRERGRITGFTSPRYIHFVSPSKAYVTQLWDNRIAIVDPQRYEITGYITVPDMDRTDGSTEQMVQIGRYVYVNCWSYQDRILKIDTQTDSVVAQLRVGRQPNSLVADQYNRLWTICDGNCADEPPALYRIDTGTFQTDGIFNFYPGDEPSEVTVNADGDRLYWINDDIWSMDVAATRLPLRPVIRSNSTRYYGLTVDPSNGDIYVADAIDYQQAGIVYRFSATGTPLGHFTTGITPGAFCWKNSAAR